MAYKKPNEDYSIIFHHDVANGRVDVGTLFAIGYQDGTFYMVKVNWEAEEDYEHSRDGEVRMTWHFYEGNAKKSHIPYWKAQR